MVPKTNKSSPNKSLPKIRLPGLGLPYHHYARTTGFPLAIDGTWSSHGVTLYEQQMLRMVSEITDKPDWHKKVFDDEIVGKWRKESVNTEPTGEGHVYFSNEMFDFCIQELRDKAKHFEKLGRVFVLDAELTVVKSDSAVSAGLRDQLRNAIRPLEDVPDHRKDWHPGSNNQVLDLVHPSLFPVVYGLTRVLESEHVPLKECTRFIGKGKVLDTFDTAKAPTIPLDYNNLPSLWGSYQWLPSEVKLKQDGSTKITSYINNLHPHYHDDLYGVLEKLVAATIPLWEDCLSGSFDRRRIVIENAGESDWGYPEGLKYPIPGPNGEILAHANPDPTEEELDKLEKIEGIDQDWQWSDDFSDWKETHRILVEREPREYIPQEELWASQPGIGVRPKKDRNVSHPFAWVDLHKDYPDGLQVIFKLAAIHLTPENPQYPGGSWHVEGALNEMICASAIYYFDQENITPSHLAFRHYVSHEELLMLPEQNEHASLEAYMGIEQESNSIQDLGKVLTSEGRLLVFPNVLQHQVQPFSLEDSAKPGHRKILAMFLVDPRRPILSTANVPPQRRDWWADELRDASALSSLPNELFDHTMAMVGDFPMSWKQAVDVRAKLMDERKGLSNNLSTFYETTTVSFCEH